MLIGNKTIRFEHILQIYWTKGLFFGGMLFYSNKTFYNIFKCTPGLGLKNKLILTNRLELSNSINVNLSFLTDFTLIYKKNIVGMLNRYYSQLASVNNQPNDLLRLNILRLYLVRSYRGRCHALGKPVRGQRTWSNSWTSYKINLILRRFIGEMKSKIAKTAKVEKINFRVTKKK